MHKAVIQNIYSICLVAAGTFVFFLIFLDEDNIKAKILRSLIIPGLLLLRVVHVLIYRNEQEKLIKLYEERQITPELDSRGVIVSWYNLYVPLFRSKLILPLILIPIGSFFFIFVYPIALVPPYQNYTFLLHLAGMGIWGRLLYYTDNRFHFFPKQPNSLFYAILVSIILSCSLFYAFFFYMPFPDLFGGRTSCSKYNVSTNHIEYECHNIGIDITGETRYCCYKRMEGQNGWPLVHIVERD